MNERKDIIIIEDDSVVSDLVSDIVLSAGFKPVAFESGHQGLVHLNENKNRTALVYIDFMLPNLEAHCLISLAKAIDKNIPLLICSGLPQAKEELNDILNDNTLAFIEKPFEVDSLIKVLISMVSQSRL